MISCPCSCGDESGKPGQKSVGRLSECRAPEGPSLLDAKPEDRPLHATTELSGSKVFAARVAPRFERTLASGAWSDDCSSQSSLRLANSQRPGRIVSSQSRDSDETFHDMAPFLLRMIVRYSVELLNAVKRRITLVFVLFSNWSHTYAFEFIWQITILCGAH